MKKNEFKGYWTYDKLADAGYISFYPDVVKRSYKTISVRLNPKAPGNDMIVDFDEEGRIIGIELLSEKIMPGNMR